MKMNFIDLQSFFLSIINKNILLRQLFLRMKNQDEITAERNYQLPIIFLNSEEKLLVSHQKSDELIDQQSKYLVPHFDTSNATDPMLLKNTRYDKFNFLKKQSKKFKSLKCSIRKNPYINHPPEDQERNSTSMSKKTDSTIREIFLRESLQKNSIMNKILTQQIKSKNFNLLKNSLFESLNPKPNLDSIHSKNQIHATKEKMAALLSERPFPKKSSFGIPFGKLKMVKNLKQVQRRNAHLDESIRFVDSRTKNHPKKQNDDDSSLKSSHIKSPSFDSLQKSTILTDELKRIFKRIDKEPSIDDRNSRIFDNEKRQKKKKTLLTISDDENETKSNLEISVEMPTKKRVMTEPNEETKTKKQLLENNKLKKCQEKIMNDLIRLEKMRNQHIFNNRGQTQLKNLKANGFNNNRIKLMIIDRKQQHESKHSKYTIKFKTQPSSNPLQQLKSRINSQIKDDQINRRKLMTIAKEVLQVHKFKERPITLQRKNSTSLAYSKIEKEKTGRYQTTNDKANYLEKQLSGWDISKQTDTKENWSMSLF